MSRPLIYLDNNATTALAPAALDAMLPFLREQYGNPASAHQLAERPAAAVRQARTELANLLGAQPREIYFTSGATESLHWAIRGALARNPARRHLVTTAVEHPCVLKLCRALEAEGIEVSYLPVNPAGALDLTALEAAITPATALVSVIWANNETGVLFPAAELARLAHQHGALLHLDGCQAVGKLPIDLAVLPVDLLSLSAHKLHGPKGVGALFIRHGLKIAPLFHGDQERGARGGTLNVPAIVGLGAAAALAARDMAAQTSAVAALRDRLEAGILRQLPSVRINGQTEPRLPGTSSVSFSGFDGEAIMQRFDRRGIAVANGAACAAGGSQPSHVLRAMGLDEAAARGTVRFSLGRDNSAEEIEQVLALLPEIVCELAQPATHLSAMQR